jgi:hypothetical protein
MTWDPFAEALPFTVGTVEPQLATPRVALHRYVLGVDPPCIMDGLLMLIYAVRTTSAGK